MNDFPMIANVLLAVVALNVVLTGVSKGLAMIQDKTKTDVDNRTVAFLNKLTGFLSKLVDAVGFNPKH